MNNSKTIILLIIVIHYQAAGVTRTNIELAMSHLYSIHMMCMCIVTCNVHVHVLWLPFTLRQDFNFIVDY